MMAKHYKQAYKNLFARLPKWKQHAVVEDSKNNHWSGVLIEFIQSVIYTAENEYDTKVIQSAVTKKPRKNNKKSKSSTVLK